MARHPPHKKLFHDVCRRPVQKAYRKDCPDMIAAARRKEKGVHLLEQTHAVGE